MKRLFTSALMALLAASSVFADWKPSDTSYTVLADYNVYGQGQMKTLRAADGTIVHTWLQTADSLSYNDPQFGYYLHMQIFDPQGNALFGNDGVLVSQQPTLTYTTDYDVKFAENGDVLLAYWDVRRDTVNRLQGDAYVYRYNLKGEPVWAATGVKVPQRVFRNGGHLIAPQLAVAGSNIYFSSVYVEYYKEKATEDNWEPSPWFPDEQMPDSVDLSYSEYQIQLLDNDGQTQWEQPLTLQTDGLQIYPCSSDLYLLFANDSLGLSARRIDATAADVWKDSVVVEPEALTSSSYFPEITVEPDGEGGLSLFYRKLYGWTGYMAMNRLRPDGTVLPEAVSLNASVDGDGDNVKAAVNRGKALTAWSYVASSTSKQLCVNLLSTDGASLWTGERQNGYALGENELWGFTAVKVIPRVDGWVLLYGESTSWNGANFYATKIDDEGNTVWKKQLLEDGMTSSGFSVVSDDTRAYIFYTCDREIGDDWEEEPGEGGMRVLCVDITDAGNVATNIDLPATDGDQSPRFYTLQGQQLPAAPTSGVYIVRQGGKAHKVVVK